MNMKKYILFFVFTIYWVMCSPSLALAQNVKSDNAEVLVLAHKQKGDSLYTAKKYDEAKNEYVKAMNIADENSLGVSAELYYNLGSSYYRLDSVAKSILFFERAYLLEPSNKDVEHNLVIARAKAKDKILLVPEIFLVRWFNALASNFSYDQSALIAIVSFVLMLIAFAIYLISNKDKLRRAFLVSVFVLLFVAVLFNLFAYQRYKEVETKDRAIIMAPSITVRSTPDNSGNSLFILHEGTKVALTGQELSGWCEIKLSDGKIGWLPVQALEII